MAHPACKRKEKSALPGKPLLFLRGAAFLAALIFLAACTPRDGCLEEGKVLRIGTTKDGLRSASLLGDTSLAAYAQIGNPPLMRLNQDGKTEGLLVEKYEVSGDYKTWRFTLRPGLYWSDGIKVTAEDVKYTIELLAAEVPYARWLRDTVEDLFAQKERDLVLKLRRPNTRLDFDFCTYNLLPRHVWEGNPNPLRHILTGEIVGCGPFIISSTDLDAGKIVFRRNPFWKGKKPDLEGLELQLFTNEDVLALALEKGEVDTYYRYASSYPYTYLNRLKASGRFAFIERPHLGFKFLGFNLRRPPASNPQFREAVAYALDYREMVKLDLSGYGEVPRRGFVPPSMPGFQETPRLLFNPEKARELLRRFGYIDRNGNGHREDKEGKEVNLVLLTSPEYARLAELVRDYLQDVGLAVTLRSVDGNTWTSMKDRFDYDLVISRTTPWGMLMHASWATGYFDSRRTGEGVLHTVDDKEFHRLCDGILATRDEAALTEYAARVQDYYARRLPALALHWSRIIIPYHRKYSGWFFSPLYGTYNIQTFLNLRTKE